MMTDCPFHTDPRLNTREKPRGDRPSTCLNLPAMSGWTETSSGPVEGWFEEMSLPENENNFSDKFAAFMLLYSITFGLKQCLGFLSFVLMF